MFVLSCAVVGGIFAEGIRVCIQFIVILYNVFGKYIPEGYIHHIYSLSEVQYLLSVLVDITWGLSVVYVCTNHKLVHMQNMYLPV